MVKVKVCGIKDAESALAACEYGADYLGFIFVKDTPRALKKSEAAFLVKGIPKSFKKGVLTVGLFKNESPEEVVSTVLMCGLDMVQLQGEEKPEECAFIKKKAGCFVAKAFKVTPSGVDFGGHAAGCYEACDYFVFDTFHPSMSGGTGETFDWKVLAAESHSINKPFFVAGGLDPDNVKKAITALKPYGVDVSSGVESSPGKKDKKMLKEFIENAKAF